MQYINNNILFFKKYSFKSIFRNHTLRWHYFSTPSYRYIYEIRKEAGCFQEDQKYKYHFPERIHFLKVCLQKNKALH